MNLILKIIAFLVETMRTIIKWLLDWVLHHPPSTPGPHITQVNPFFAYPGSVIDITGSGFAAVLDGNIVMVGGEPARVIRASGTALKRHRHF